MEDKSGSEIVRSTQKELLCKYCQQQLNAKSKVCWHCGRDQRLFYQYFASSTAFLMVIIAVSQAVMGWLQYDESKKKRIEAEEVLLKAQQASDEMKTESYNTLKFAKEKAQLSIEMTNKSTKEIIATKMLLQDLAVSLTEPVTTALASQIKFTIQFPLKDKIHLIEHVGESLRKLGVAEKEINRAIYPFTTTIWVIHMRIILSRLNEALPKDNKIFKDPYEVDIYEWNLNRVDKTLKEHNIQPGDKLKKAILDLEYYEKFKKLRNENSW